MTAFLFGLMANVAAATASLLQAYPTAVLRHEVVSFKAIKAHHFSPEAPQSCGDGSLVENTPTQVKCQFAAAGPVHATFNICDDKKTFCKTVGADLTVREQSAAEARKLLVKNQDLNRAVKHALVPGFAQGTPAAMRAAAAKAGKPVFLMISTDWCPPCNEAKEHLLASETFKKTSDGWFKIYVDGDALEADEWDRIVPYRYFPSFVYLDRDLKEVARYTGPLREQEFKAWAAKVGGWTGDPIAAVRARVLARFDKSLTQRLSDWMRLKSEESRRSDETRLLKWALDQDDQDLLERFGKTYDVEKRFPEQAADWLRHRLDHLSEADRKNGQYIDMNNRLLDLLRTEDGWAAVLDDFCSTDAKACAPHLREVDARLEFLAKRPGLTQAERASWLGEEYTYLTDVYQMLGRKTEEQKLARDCVKSYDRLAPAAPSTGLLKVSRAAHQGQVTCLELAGRYSEAEAVLKPLIAAYPSEPTFLTRMARVLRREKKLAPALVWIGKAEEVAYGYNWFSTELLKADILIELKRGGEAASVIDAALGRVNLDSTQDSRDQAVVARLRGLQAKLENLKNP
jgi:thiol-disulfide isomerase/thioredoxin